MAVQLARPMVFCITIRARALTGIQLDMVGCGQLPILARTVCFGQPFAGAPGCNSRFVTVLERGAVGALQLILPCCKPWRTTCETIQEIMHCYSIMSTCTISAPQESTDSMRRSGFELGSYVPCNAVHECSARLGDVSGGRRLQQSGAIRRRTGNPGDNTMGSIKGRCAVTPLVPRLFSGGQKGRQRFQVVIANLGLAKKGHGEYT